MAVRPSRAESFKWGESPMGYGEPIREIAIYGAREHNLKDVTVRLPKGAMIAVTGLSGSGKSTLVRDVLFAEAQRQYLESLSSYARRSMSRPEAADFDRIEGLSPCIAVDQDQPGRNPRSTVGTYSEIYTHIRLLFSRVASPVLSAAEYSFNSPAGACEECAGIGSAARVDVERLFDRGLSLNEGAIRHRTWKVGSRYWNIIQASEMFDMDKKLGLFSREELALLLSSPPIVLENNHPGYVQSFSFEGMERRLQKRRLDARGLGAADYDSQFFIEGECSMCGGARLKQVGRDAQLPGGLTMGRLLSLEMGDALRELKSGIGSDWGPVGRLLVPLISNHLTRMAELGIGYLSLNRSVGSLSGGEAQKVKLAKQLLSNLTDIIYVLDEPTSGLHARDVDRLGRSLRSIVDRGNTVIVIEHEPDIVRVCDFVVDMGPGAGVNGGEVIVSGPLAEVANCPSSSMFGLLAPQKAPVRKSRHPRTFLSFDNVWNHNLRGISVAVPKAVLTCLTGVSGSGKSSLIEWIAGRVPGAVIVDQGEVGSNPRANTATYVGIFDDVRDLFASVHGVEASLFSFNSEGSCPDCLGLGRIETDMHFLGDVSQVCETCEGSRYRPGVLDYRVNGKNIADVLDMTVDEAVEFFAGSSRVRERLELLAGVGLYYITLGQPLNTLSGGERQRLKLSQRLAKKSGLVIVDEPTRGLHPKDIDRLLSVLDRLAESGVTVLVVEHNLDVIGRADWVIDMGPEAGKDGGTVVYAGPVSDLVRERRSVTGRLLAERLRQ